MLPQMVPPVRYPTSKIPVFLRFIPKGHKDDRMDSNSLQTVSCQRSSHIGKLKRSRVLVYWKLF